MDDGVIGDGVGRPCVSGSPADGTAVGTSPLSLPAPAVGTGTLSVGASLNGETALGVSPGDVPAGDSGTCSEERTEVVPPSPFPPSLVAGPPAAILLACAPVRTMRSILPGAEAEKTSEKLSLRIRRTNRSSRLPRSRTESRRGGDFWRPPAIAKPSCSASRARTSSIVASCATTCNSSPAIRDIVTASA